MSPTAILFIVLIAAILLYMPIAYAIGLAVAAVLLLCDLAPFEMFYSVLYSSSDSFSLLAVPFFILSGDVMAKCGISKRLINLARAFVGNLTGGMGMVTVLACMFFAAISGSGIATAAAIGGIMIPIMIQENYDAGYSAALTSASSAIGPIIPPSVSFIVYGVLCGVSVTDLFMAGAVPGIIMGLFLMIANWYMAKRHGYGMKSGHKMTWKQKLAALNDAKWSILAPVIILGGIYSGIFTPTEAAIIATDYSLVVGLFIYREIQFKDLAAIAKTTANSVGLSMALLGFATVFGRILVMERIPTTLANAIQSATDSKFVVLLLINLVLLLAGMFLETFAAITISAPILLAIATGYGVSPLHLGIIICVNLAIGLSTPPVGASLFVSASIAKVPIEKTFKPLIPMMIASLAGLALITYCEPIVTFLPNLLG